MSNAVKTPKKIIDQIKQRSLKLAIIGAGYVGLPTAALFANVGFSVAVLDLKLEVINALNNGTSCINEPGLNDLIYKNVKKGKLKGFLNYDLDLTKIDAMIIAVQTPIDENRKPCLK